MAVFVLVHGGSHGGWCWEACADQLRLLGHEAMPFDLPGHGDDRTPRGQVTLDRYAERINEVLSRCGSKSPVLVGHSLAGVGIARALELHPRTLERLVLVAALVLEPGERAIDRIPNDRRPLYHELAEASPDSSFSLTEEITRRVFFNDLSDADAARNHARLTPQPLAVYLKAPTLALSSLPCPKHYLACQKDQALGLESNLLYAKRLGGSLSLIDAGHDVMLSEPVQLAECLIQHCRNADGD